MRTDPNKACANESEKLCWAIIHDLFAHPLMVMTGYSRPALAFHDYTSHKAWEREKNHFVLVTSDFAQLESARELFKANKVPIVTSSIPGNGVITYTLEILK